MRVSLAAAFRVTAQLVVVSLFTLVLAELVLRAYNPLRPPVRANNIALPINRTFVGTNPNNRKADEVLINTYNGLGFRGAEYPENPAEHLKIFTVGGSTTACVMLSDGKTWPDVLYQRLQQSSSRYWLNNAGIDGHSTFGHLVLLERYLLDFRPDYIVFLIGVNDVERADLTGMDPDIMPELQPLKQRIIAASELLSTAQTIKQTMLAYDMGVIHQHDMDVTELPTVDLSTAEMATQVERQAEYVSGYVQRVSRLIQLTRAAGAEPIFLTQPALYGAGIDPTTSVELSNLEYRQGVSSELQWLILEQYNDALRELAAQQNVFLIDVAASMPKDSKYYFDWVHYSNEGAALLGRIVADHLIDHFGDQRTKSLTTSRAQ